MTLAGINFFAAFTKRSNLIFANKLKTFFTVFIIATICFSARRPDQFMNPEVWNEDGLLIIPQLLSDGFKAIFYPTNGYIILPSRLISWISLKVSFLYYPIVSNIIGIFVQSACVAAIAVVPTYQRNPILAALLLLFLPMDAEVYQLPQYSFWWVTVLMFTTLIWLPDRAVIWRYSIALLGSLSSPMVVMIMPLAVLRLILSRQWRQDGIYAAILLIGATIQLSLVFLSDPIGRQALGLKVIPFLLVFLPFCTVPLFAKMERSERLAFLALIMIAVASWISTAMRVPVEIISPTGAGPRYFFLPYAMLAWLLAWVIGLGVGYRILAFVLIIAVLPTSVTYFQRRQSPNRDWQEAVAKCLKDGAIMPIQFDGRDVFLYADYPESFYDAEMCNQAMKQAIY